MLIVENTSGVALAYLNNILNGFVREVINGEYVLEFTITIDPLKTIFLYDEENMINYNNDLFKVVDIKELHNETEDVTVSITCEHNSYKLINTEFEDFDYPYADAVEVMTACLANSGLTLRNCDITEKTAIQYTQPCNAKQISIAIANNWNGELKYYRNYVDLLKSRGQNRGTTFIFGKNLKSVQRFINFNDDTLTYEVDVTIGSELEDLSYYELGDTVRIIDHRLDIDVEKKIIEIEKDIVTGINSSVILGDSIKDIRSSFTTVNEKVAEVEQTIKSGAPNWDKINGITNSIGEIVIGKKNELTNVVSKIINSTGTYQQLDNFSYWQDQPTKEDSTFASMWGPMGMAYASTKDEYGEWIWTSIFDSDGVIANRVTVNALYGMLIQAVDIQGSTITGSEIIGSTISGSTVLAGDIAVTGNITWNTDNSPAKAQYSQTGTGNWHVNFVSGQDLYARYTYDGGITWTPAIKIVGEQGAQGVPGPQGPQGSQGIQGPAGVDGKTLYTWVKYADTSTGTGMSDSPTGKRYIGLAYNKTTATESSIASDYSWSLIQGDQGIQGPAGANGQTLYTWLKYADTPTTGMNDSPTGKKYMGIAYNKTTATESTSYSDYSWSLIQGEQGIQGPQGVPGVQGPAGADGQTLYTWVKYADSSTGSGMSDLPDGKKYIGLAYNKTTATESTVATDYSWSLIQGPQGSQGIQGPSGANGQTLYTWLKYADTPTSGMSDSPTGKKYMGLAYNKTTATESTSYSDYSWSLIQGEQGPQGVQGPAGTNGQTLYTWVKYGTSSTGAGMSDSPTGKTYIGLAYNKTSSTPSATASDYTWALIQGPQGSQGIQGPAGSNGQTLYTWLKYADSPTSGMSDSPTGKKYMGLAYNKTTATESTTYSDYSWSLIQGAQGVQGPQGVAGPKGETGATGAQGIQGPAGADGKPTYTWVKYALDQYGNGLWDIIGAYRVNELANAVSTYTGITVANMENRKYIGLAHNKTTAVESTNKADYQWSLIAGDDGITYYTWYAYADDIRGSGLSFDPMGKAYMGVRYNAVSPVKTKNPLDYEWVKIKGENGSDANVPAYIKETYIDSVLIQSPTIQGNVINAGVITGGYIQGTRMSGSIFESYMSDGTKMELDSGLMKFTAPSGVKGYYDNNGWDIFGVSGHIWCDCDMTSSLGTGATLTSSGAPMIIGNVNTGSYARFNHTRDVQIYAGTGDLYLSTYNSGVNWIYLEGKVEAASLAVTGSKQAIVPTQHYGTRSLYCEEADRSYFSTKGLNYTVNNECIIELDPIFMETIELNSTCPYIILLTSYSDARVWVEQVEDHMFIVRSDKDTKFAYDLKAIRISYTNIYLEETQLSPKKLRAIQTEVVERMKT